MPLALLAAIALAGDLDALTRDFEAHTGATLVFEAEALPPGNWFEILVPLASEDRAEAAEILLREARHYPPGYLADTGFRAVGVFAAIGTLADDGFHAWDERLGGYAYYGMYNGAGAMIAAHYTDGQLPLTFHHEVFHHLDASTGATADDARFAAAVAGEAPYPAPAIASADLAALRRLRRLDGPLLRDAVGAYSAKAPGEDQAEAARHLQANLPDALVQVVERPELPGSQRFLHVIAELDAAGDADFDWLVDVALRRTERARRVAATQSWAQQRFRPAGAWVVHGQEDADGVNWTLREDVARAGTLAAHRGDPVEAIRDLALLADYHAFIAARWQVTSGTRETFETARTEIVRSLPPSHRALADAVAHATLEELAASLDAEDIDPRSLTRDVVGDLAAGGVRVNPHLGKVDAEMSGPWREAIRRAQPATVRISSGGSGVAIRPDGLILTAGHVVDSGTTYTVWFPDGSEHTADRVALDTTWDLGLIRIRGPVDVPFAAIAPSAPRAGDPVAVIGQPGRSTPDGHPTGYQPFQVSTGQIRGFLDDRLGDQGLGRTKHDAWTYWGHSGSPLFDDQGRIVALHNSWDSRTAMRHAVTWEAIARFVAARDHR